MKYLIASLLFFPLFAFAQITKSDSMELHSVGVWHPIPSDYGIHSMWIDCENPLLFVNENIDFSLMEYDITGGKIILGKADNEILIVPYENDIAIELLYKKVLFKTFQFKARKLPLPFFEVINGKNDTLTMNKSIKSNLIPTLKIINAIDDRLEKDLYKVPISKITSIDYKLTRVIKDKNVLVYTTSQSNKLTDLKKKAKKGDKLVIYATFSTTRFSHISNKQLTNKTDFLRSYVIE